jgi:hypothetical protein
LGHEEVLSVTSFGAIRAVDYNISAASSYPLWPNFKTPTVPDEVFRGANHTSDNTVRSDVGACSPREENPRKIDSRSALIRCANAPDGTLISKTPFLTNYG